MSFLFFFLFHHFSTDRWLRQTRDRVARVRRRHVHRQANLDFDFFLLIPPILGTREKKQGEVSILEADSWRKRIDLNSISPET